MSKNIEMNLKLDSGSYEILYPETTANLITSGILDINRIPDLSASKVTSGTFTTDRIPSLSASKINSGTLDSARIPSLSASKITSGTFGTTDDSSYYIFNAPVRFQSKNNSVYSNKVNFGDGDEVYLQETGTDGRLIIHANNGVNITTNGGTNLLINGSNPFSNVGGPRGSCAIDTITYVGNSSSSDGNSYRTVYSNSFSGYKIFAWTITCIDSFMGTSMAYIIHETNFIFTSAGFSSNTDSDYMTYYVMGGGKQSTSEPYSWCNSNTIRVRNGSMNSGNVGGFNINGYSYRILIWFFKN